MEELHDERKEVNLLQMLEEVMKDTIPTEDIKDVYVRLKDILEKVDLSILDSIQFEPSQSGTKRRKILKSNYENIDDGQLLEEIKKQIDAVRNALLVIYDLENANFKNFLSQKRRFSNVIFFKKLRELAEALPLWVDLEGEDPPPLCGSIGAEENYVASVGDLVAAKNVKEDCANWILAEVTAYDPIKREYTVDDIYEVTATQQILNWDDVIPLPKLRADPCNNPNAFFHPSEEVLALYPTTTCFYHAYVYKMPSTAEEPYALIFDDEKIEQFVHQRFVIRNVYQGTHKE